MDIIKWTPSQELSHTFPEFQEVRIYGTSDAPLFNTKDTETLLELGRQQYSRDYILGKDYIKCETIADDGRVREQNFLTERGLYGIMWKSRTAMAEKFKDFVTIVLQELRLKGKVDLSVALEKLEKKAFALEAQLDEEHRGRLIAQKESEKFFKQKTDQAYIIEKLKQDAYRATPKNSDSYILNRVKEKVFKPVFVYKVAPPRDVVDDFIEDDMDPDEDQEFCFEISNKARDAPATVELQVLPGVLINHIKEKLVARGFQLMIKNKPHKSYYRGTIEQVRDMLDEFITE